METDNCIMYIHNMCEKIFNFNHISKNLSNEKINEIKNLYKYYHKKYWCYKKLFQHYQKMHLSTNIGSSLLVVTGTIAGGITLNPIIIGVISGCGVLLQTYATAKNYDRKLEHCKFAYTSYNNLLIELRDSLCLGVFDEKLFFNKAVVFDNIINENCVSIPEKIITKYNKKFIFQSTNKDETNIPHNYSMSFWI